MLQTLLIHLLAKTGKNHLYQFALDLLCLSWLYNYQIHSFFVRFSPIL